MSEKYKIRDEDKIYFITFAVVHCVDVFTRREYNDLIIESLKHCQRKKGLEVYAWVIMSNHLHLALGTSGQELLTNVIRDFLKYTSVALIRAIQENEQESRKEWMLAIFQKAAENSSKHQKYQFWQNQYHSVALTNNDKQQRCMDYIHQNTVKAGMVTEAEHYVYSSALDYAWGKGLLPIKFIE